MRIDTPTAALASWIQRKIGPVMIGHIAHIGSVLHEDGSDLTNRERNEVLALIAADAAEPLKETTMDDWAEQIAAIKNAETLGELRDSLNSLSGDLWEARINSGREGLKLTDLVELDDLELFGGEEPGDTTAIYSWDETHVMTWGEGDACAPFTTCARSEWRSY